MSDASTESKPKASSGSSGVKSFLSGGFGGMCLVMAGHPLDLLKTLAENGIRGMYRGMGAPLVGATPVFAICFWGYDQGQRIMRSVYNLSPEDKLTTNQILFAGGRSWRPWSASNARSRSAEPTERLFTRARSTRPWALCGTGGISSLFKGTCATLLRDVPGSVAYFGAYELIKKALTDRSAGEGAISPLAIVTAGGLAGMANWAVAIPPDVLKSRLQTAPDGKYSGVRQVFIEMMRTEGAGALFRGMGPALLRAFPANAACFLGVELSRKAMDKVF
ncbi:mitochondrial carrier [Linderina pennispora]|uniref:Mitochondrial carrier n=1 Tax=Linderina pennispora TaxID=61395 RepID=A0A1Y1W595_9FUNG|nr:mitochondrial carrier [Linderina pennispora]ORX68709.1 mitochondrial carrier [Linderina pennispora]